MLRGVVTEGLAAGLPSTLVEVDNIFNRPIIPVNYLSVGSHSGERVCVGGNLRDLDEVLALEVVLFDRR